MNKLILYIFITLTTLSVSAQVWSDDFIGIDSIWNYDGPGGSGNIYDMHNDGDSVLYMGGAFYYINQEIVSKFASWNTNSVKIYQEGVGGGGGINAITKYNNNIIVAGNFSNASDEPNTANLAEWNGYHWQAFNGGGVNGEIKDLLVYNDTLFICGNFDEIGSFNCNMIASYTNGNWIEMGFWGQWVSSLEILNGELYGGGYYGLRKYIGGGEWEIFPDQPNGNVYELKTDTINTFMYVCGGFNHVGDSTSYGAAMWDGFEWHYSGQFCSTTPWAQTAAIYRGDLFLGCGRYYESGDQYRTYITRWNGEVWDSVGGAFNDNIFALEVFRDTLYIGGGYTYWGGSSPELLHRSKGLVKLYMPDNGCDYLKPRINTWADTVYLEGGIAELNFYNNNPYANSWEWDFGSAGIVGSSERNPVVTFTEPGEYDVQVTVTQDGCIKTANKTVWVLLSDDIGNFSSPGQIKMQVFPNPSSNGFTVKTSLTSYKNVQIKIAGLNGHLKDIIPVTNETTIISTKGWKPGTYVCNLFVDGRFVKAEKLVFE